MTYGRNLRDAKAHGIKSGSFRRRYIQILKERWASYKNLDCAGGALKMDIRSANNLNLFKEPISAKEII